MGNTVSTSKLATATAVALVIISELQISSVKLSDSERTKRRMLVSYLMYAFQTNIFIDYFVITGPITNDTLTIP